MLACAAGAQEPKPDPPPPNPGLSWTAMTFEEGRDCVAGATCTPSRLSIRVNPTENVIGLQMHSVGVLVVASNVAPADLAAKKMDVTMTFETADHVKATQTRNDVPIQDYAVDGKAQVPPLKYSSSFFNSMDVAIVKVLAIDTVEKSIGPDGKTIETVHKFRAK